MSNDKNMDFETLKQKYADLRWQYSGLADENKRLRLSLNAMICTRNVLEEDLQSTKKLLDKYREKFEEIIWSVDL